MHNGVLHDLYCLPDIIWMIKSRRISWVGHVGRVMHTLSWLGKEEEDYLVDIVVDERTVLNRVF